jgi:hypothetical protein
MPEGSFGVMLAGAYTVTAVLVDAALAAAAPPQTVPAYQALFS